jgi:hypothetical protein
VQDRLKTSERRACASLGHSKLAEKIRRQRGSTVQQPNMRWQPLEPAKEKGHGDRWKAHPKERAQALLPRVEVTLKTP